MTTPSTERSEKANPAHWFGLSGWHDEGAGYRTRHGVFAHPLGIVAIDQWLCSRSGGTTIMQLVDRNGRRWTRWWDDAPSRYVCARRAREFLEQRAQGE